MSNSIQLKCDNSDRKFSLTLNQEADGEQYVEVGLSGPVTLKKVVYFYKDWSSFCSFLEDISSSWRGWEGCKSFESVEGDLVVRAKHDRRGNVIFDVIVKDRELEDPFWKVELSLSVELGKLSGNATSV